MTAPVRRTHAQITVSRPVPRPANIARRRIGALLVVGVVAAVVAALLGGSSEDKTLRPTAPSEIELPAQEAVAPAAVAAPTLAPTSAAPLTTVATPATTPASALTAKIEAPATSSAAPTTTVDPEVATVDPTVEVIRMCAKQYEVTAGDYWILIARKVGVTLSDVLTVNEATSETPLFPGRSICLPADATPPTTEPPATTPTTDEPTTTTAAPTTTAPAPTTTTPPRTYTQAEAEAIIREVWPDDLEDEAVRIATRESNLTPTAKNWCCYGLFQIYWNVHQSWLKPAGITSSAMLLQPEPNARAAYMLYQRAGGWGPWDLG